METLAWVVELAKEDDSDKARVLGMRRGDDRTKDDDAVGFKLEALVPVTLIVSILSQTYIVTT